MTQPMTQPMTHNQLTENSVTQLLNNVRLARDNAERDDNRVDHSFYYALTRALEELQERRKAERDSEPVAWTDEEELRDANEGGSGYLFGIGHDANKFADPRRQIMLYRHAQQPVVPEEKPMPNPLSMYAVDAVAAIAEVKGWNACRAAMLQAGDTVRDLSTPVDPQVAEYEQNVLQAGNSPVIPEGYVMVPKEPTSEMIWAAKYCFTSTPGWDVFKSAYKAMLAAAPQEVNHG
ncbi:siphovirus Gp157 family protein [Klebsiella michiganensis]